MVFSSHLSRFLASPHPQLDSFDTFLNSTPFNIANTISPCATSVLCVKIWQAHPPFDSLFSTDNRTAAKLPALKSSPARLKPSKPCSHSECHILSWAAAEPEHNLNGQGWIAELISDKHRPFLNRKVCRCIPDKTCSLLIQRVPKSKTNKQNSTTKH